MVSKLKPLIIGDKEIKIPIVQGGMGAKVSTASLASAVAECGGAGTIASVGLAVGTEENETEYFKASRENLEREIRQAKQMSTGVIGVNIMVALTNYEDLVRATVRENADFIVSGAGLPLRLPEYTKGSSVKLLPIVSSARVTELICRTWSKRYDRVPDAIVVEGPLAGGHLGFGSEELKQHKEASLEELVKEVLEVSRKYEKAAGVSIPIIAAGGIFDGKDIARFLRLGASGVQMGTRFVATNESSVPQKFKELYVSAREEDVVVIDSPVGLPGRVIKTEFTAKAMKGERMPISCDYQCLKPCDPNTVPYCIGKAMINAVTGDIDNAIVFAGSNVYRVKEIVPVKELMDELVRDTIKELDRIS